jgi:hypothetical protein
MIEKCVYTFSDEFRALIYMIPVVLVNSFLQFLWFNYPHIITLIVIVILSITCVRLDIAQNDLSRCKRKLLSECNYLRNSSYNLRQM